jgi:hypothetical protein
MSNRIRDFVENWLEENHHPVGYEDEGDSESKQTAKICYAAAQADGITKSQIDQEFGELAPEIASRHEQMIDSEVKRRADKEE